MSLLDTFFSGSLVGRARLLEARDFYAPASSAPAPQPAFAQWTERVATQAPLIGARQLAGLSDDELNELESEFLRSPQRPRDGRSRHAVAAGSVLVVAAVLGFVLATVFGAAGNALSVLQWVAVGCLAVGLPLLGMGLYSGFGTMHLDIGHGTTGLYVGKLDEQHPWVYEAADLTVHAAAETYRQRVLQERGPLRGVDCVLMRHLVRAQQSIDETRGARSVAEQLQSQPEVVVDPMRPLEPRLVRVPARSTPRLRSNGQSAH